MIFCEQIKNHSQNTNFGCHGNHPKWQQYIKPYYIGLLIIQEWYVT